MNKLYRKKWIPFLLTLALLSGAFAPAAAMGDEQTADFLLTAPQEPVTGHISGTGDSEGEDNDPEAGAPDQDEEEAGADLSGLSFAEAADFLTDTEEAAAAEGISASLSDDAELTGSEGSGWIEEEEPALPAEGESEPDGEREEEGSLYDSPSGPAQETASGNDSEGLIEDEQADLAAAADEAPYSPDSGMILLPQGIDPTVLGEPEVITQVWVNPVYGDVISPEDLVPAQSELEAEMERACEAAQETAQELDASLAAQMEQVLEASREQGGFSDTVEESAEAQAAVPDTVPDAGQEQAASPQAAWDMTGRPGDDSLSAPADSEETAQELTDPISWEEASRIVGFETDQVLAEQGYYQTGDIAAMASEIRGFLKSRTTRFSIGMAVPLVPGARKEEIQEGIKAQARQALYAAMEHTGVPTEGDYLLYQLGGGYECITKFTYHNSTFCIITYTMTYYTTAEQEAWMDQEVARLLPSFKSAGSTSYARVKAAYDYLGANVSYDSRVYIPEYKKNYLPMYTGYAALKDKKAVCQGYSVALYRLLLEMGIECRVIGGKAPGRDGELGGHAWNIIRLGSRYYNADSTWDASPLRHNNFLKAQSETGFDKEHIRDSEYRTAAFIAAHPMSTSDYPTGENVCPGGGTHLAVQTSAVAAGCTTPGCTAGTVCSKCGQTLSGREAVPPTGHTYKDWETVSPATISAPGLYVRSCVRCRIVQHRYTDKAAYLTLNVTKKTIKLKKGKTRKLVIEFAPGDKVTRIKSSKPKIVSVTKKGKIKARNRGRAKITVTLQSGLKKSFWVKVT